MPTERWTTIEIAVLLEMQINGRSTREIGDKIGRTKNAVIGRLHRMGYCKPTGKRPDQWHANKVATLTTLLNRGYTMRSAAEALGMTHGAVRSKIRREKLTVRQITNVTPGMDIRMKPEALRAVKATRVSTSTPRSEPPSRQLTIYDLKLTTCRWPQGEPGQLHYCGHEAPIDKAYCAYHHVLAHSRPRTD